MVQTKFVNAGADINLRMDNSKIASIIQPLYCLLVLIVSNSCEARTVEKVWVDPLGYSEDSLIIDLSVYKHRGEYLINDTIDLAAKTLYLCRRLYDHVFLYTRFFRRLSVRIQKR